MLNFVLKFFSLSQLFNHFWVYFFLIGHYFCRNILFSSQDEDSKLYGIGTQWCVPPSIIWRHVGVPNEPEVVARRKCITLILAILLFILVIATITTLAVGLQNNAFDDDEMPVSFRGLPNSPSLDNYSMFLTVGLPLREKLKNKTGIIWVFL